MHKIAALPAVHAWSGADHTGSLVGKEKPHGGKHSKRQSKTSSLLLLISEQVNHPASAETMAAIEKLICKLYVPNTTITSVKDLTVMRANYQAMVWNNNIVPQPQLPSPDNFGWKLDDNK